MPRPPTKSSPVRELREEILQLSQEQFGKLIGVSKSTIEKIENQKLNLSRDLILKIRHQTGCVVPPLIRGVQSKKIFNFDLKPFTREDYQEYLENNQTTLINLDDNIEAAKAALEFLLRSANRTKKIRPLLEEFERFVSKRFEDFGLQPYFAGLLKENFEIPSLEECTMINNFHLAPISSTAQFLAKYQPVSKPKVPSETPKRVKKGLSSKKPPKKKQSDSLT